MYNQGLHTDPKRVGIFFNDLLRIAVFAIVEVGAPHALGG